MFASSPPSKLLLLLAFVGASATAAGCKPRIGDDCQISTDCSASGDRLCDISAPGGYCNNVRYYLDRNWNSTYLPVFQNSVPEQT